MAYVGTNWQDYPNLGTPITAARLNNMETGIGNAYVQGTGTLVNADLAAAAAIAPSKVATVLARKVTSKAVNTSVAETDLLNGEFTLAANALGTSSLLRVVMWGDFINNTGANRTMPRFKVKFGSTVLIDTNTPGIPTGAPGATRYGWRAVAEVMNLGAANSQVVNLSMTMTFSPSSGVAQGATAATGEGNTTSFGQISASAIAVSQIVNSTAVDTTASQAITFTVINGFSDANYETKLLAAILETGG